MPSDSLPTSGSGSIFGGLTPALHQQWLNGLREPEADLPADIDPETIGRCGYEFLGADEDTTMDDEDTTMDKQFNQALKTVVSEGIATLLEGQATHIEHNMNIETEIAKLTDYTGGDHDDQQQHNEQMSKAVSDIQQVLTASISMIQQGIDKCTKAARSTSEDCKKIAKQLELYQSIATWLEFQVRGSNLQNGLYPPGLSEGVLIKVLQAQLAPFFKQQTDKFQKQLVAQEKRHLEAMGQLIAKHDAEQKARDDAASQRLERMEQVLNELLSRRAS